MGSTSATDYHDVPRLDTSSTNASVTELDLESSSADLHSGMDTTATSSSGWDSETIEGTPNDIAKSRDCRPIRPVLKQFSQKDDQL